MAPTYTECKCVVPLRKWQAQAEGVQIDGYLPSRSAQSLLVNIISLRISYLGIRVGADKDFILKLQPTMNWPVTHFSGTEWDIEENLPEAHRSDLPTTSGSRKI